MQFAFLAGALQRTPHGGAHRDHPAARRTGAPNLPDQMGADVEPLAVHVVILQVVHPHRLERDRKSVVYGQSVSVRVYNGGRRTIKQKSKERVSTPPDK